MCHVHSTQDADVSLAAGHQPAGGLPHWRCHFVAQFPGVVKISSGLGSGYDSWGEPKGEQERRQPE